MKRLTVLLLVFVGFQGCSKKGPTYVTVNPAAFAVAEISSRYNPFYAETVSIYSDTTLDLSRCSAELSFGTTRHGLYKKELFPGWIRLTDTLHLPMPGMECAILITTNLGYGQAGGVTIPGSYKLLLPAYYDTLPWDNATIVWSAARYASWYDLWVRCYVYDDMRQVITSADTVLITTGTSVQIPESFLRRDLYAAYASVSVSLYAHDGAVPGSGPEGRLVGNLPGYFFSTYIAEQSYGSFFVGPPRLVKGVMPSPLGSEAKRHQAILHAFGVPAK